MNLQPTTKDIRSDLAARVRRWHADDTDDDVIDQRLQEIGEQYGPQIVANVT
jgi:hypothetical protein